MFNAILRDTRGTCDAHSWVIDIASDYNYLLLLRIMYLFFLHTLYII